MSATTTNDRRPLDVWTALAAALGIAMFLETLRLWFPAVAYIYGRAGSTDPLELGAFALAPFLLAFVAPALVRARGARTLLLAAGAAMAVARFTAQLASGGDVQLWATTVGAFAGLLFVAAAAAGGLARAALAVGLVSALAIDAVLEALLTGGSLDWQTGAAGLIVGWLVLLALLGGFAVGLARSQPAQMVLTTRASAWAALGPVLALHFVLGGLQPPLVAATTGRVVSGSSGQLVAGLMALVVTAAYVVTVRYAFEARPSRARAWITPLLLVLAVGGVLTVQDRPVVLVPHLVLVIVLGLAAADIPTTAGRSTPARHAAAAVTGGLLLFLVVFPYYATYDLPLAAPGEAFLVVGAAGLAVGLYRAGRRGSEVSPIRAPTPGRTAAVVVSAAVAAAAIVGVRSHLDTASEVDGYPVTVTLANLHMGFSTEGVYVAPDQGRAIDAGTPDVVVLNEVDRGWALNGGQDVLRDVARQLDAPYVFAPAADEIWGNAIVSRHPVLETGWEVLPDSGGYMVRSALWVVVDVGGGRELAVVGTHLHHRGEDAAIRQPQARRVAEIAADLARDGRPVVVAGDLNAPADSPEVAPLLARLRHAAPGMPPPTYPSWTPQRAIDHVLVTPDLAATGYETIATDLSDHAWVSVTLVPAGS